MPADINSMALGRVLTRSSRSVPGIWNRHGENLAAGKSNNGDGDGVREAHIGYVSSVDVEKVK